MAIAGALFAVWPMIFKIEETKPVDKMARFRGPEKNERRFQELKPEESGRLDAASRVRISIRVGGRRLAGASKMHSLEAYPLAMIASVMAFVGSFVPLGIWLLKRPR